MSNDSEGGVETPAHAEISELARDLTDDLEPGPQLDPLMRSIIGLAVHVSVTGLDARGTRREVDAALDAGATADQIRETVLLVSTLGVHSLFLGMTALAQSLSAPTVGASTEGTPGMRIHDAQNDGAPSPFNGRHWLAIEAQAPGTLGGLMLLSPEIRASVAEYCALPWRGRALGAREKELVSLALDAVPTHCYLPGFRVHLQNARDLGVLRTAILETVAIAGDAPRRGGAR